MSKITWLASYPKSGNTWFRVFLTNYLKEDGQPADINKLSIANFSDRQWWDDALGWNTSDFTEEAISDARFDIQDSIAARSLQNPIFKTHDSFLDSRSKIRLFSPAAIRGSIYIVRNPLDVALSFANHMNQPVDVAIKKMNNMDARLADNSAATRPQLTQSLGNWSWHVTSWADSPDSKVHVMKYEDMLAQPALTFTRACEFIGLPLDDQKIQRALEYSKFETLKGQEEISGFREKPRKCEHFFNEGRAGRWREGLTKRQVNEIVKVHGGVMKRFGYDPR
jgi:aryl sulfotransferase